MDERQAGGALVTIRDLTKRYGGAAGVLALDGLNLDVPAGSVFGLLGPNGAGKTTTFYMVVGLIKPDEGTVFLDENEITSMPMYKRSQQGIGYLPQEASVFRKLSVEDNISAVLEMTTLSKKEQREKLEELIREFRLEHVRKSNGDVVSGGERRRTEIARALAVDPKFVLLDEPFAGVDPIAVEDIQEIIARLKYKNIGILITDHNVNETLSICDRAYLLIDGKIFKHGTAEELAADEQVRRLYLGRNFELKRKDYLHLEAAKKFASPDILVQKVEAALAGLEHIERVKNERIAADGSPIEGLENDLMEEEMQLNEYRQFLEELEADVRTFASETSNADLYNKTTDLYADKSLDTKTALEKLLHELKSVSYI